jgi:hypothetical protein
MSKSLGELLFKIPRTRLFNAIELYENGFVILNTFDNEKFERIRYYFGMKSPYASIQDYIDKNLDCEYRGKYIRDYLATKALEEALDL